MIKIKCTQEEKGILMKVFRDTLLCPLPQHCIDVEITCAECTEKYISWEVEDEDEDEDSM